MAHRGADRTVRAGRGGALLVGLVVLCGCGSSPATDEDGVVPLPPPATLSSPEGATATADASDGGAAPSSGPDAGAPDGADSAAPQAAGSQETSAADAAAGATADGGPPRWFPAVGAVVRLAGIAPRDMEPMIETRTVRAGGGADLHELDVEVGAVGAPAEDVARETYLITVTDTEIRVALAPDPLRQIPPPARELPRKPVVGDAWDTPAGRCRIEAVEQDVTTFVGTRSGTVRVRVTSPTGRVTLRWFDPELGEIRREVLGRDEKVLAAWALCGPEPPPLDRCREVLITGG